MIAGWFANAWAKIAACAVIVFAVLAAFAKAVSLGKSSEREKGEAKQLENVATRQNVDSSVAAGSDADNRERLRKLYTRG